MKANAIRLYKHFCEMVENPKGADLLERINVRENAKKAKAQLEQRFRTAKKYKDDPEIKDLLGEKEEDKGVKEDGKKSKR